MSDHVTGTDIHYPNSDSLWHDGVDGVLGGADVVVAELELRRVLAVAATVAIRTRSAVEGDEEQFKSDLVILPFL